MQKQTELLDEKGYYSNSDRLREIALMTFSDLSDEAILEVLAERRLITKENEAYEERRDEEMKRKAAETAERVALEQAIARLNASITPDQDDESLLSLVKQRKALEQKLEKLNGGLGITEEVVSKDASEELPVVQLDKEQELIVSTTTEGVSVEAPQIPEKELIQEEVQEEPSAQQTNDLAIGSEKVDEVLGGKDAEEYLKLLQSNPDEALARLETLPEVLRKNKPFMLQVALVDPAYAMHYADAKTLKKEEDFNVKIASMKNPRNSGNPLAEMLSDMRTSKVVMAAIKNDFRNLRYATPAMEGYADMIDLAKQGAREKAKSLGQAIDIRLFLPKTLRDDRVFLEEIENIIKAVKA